MSVVYPPSVKKCQWCTRQSDRIEKGRLCNDQLCDKCIIQDSHCQSNCPICWEKNISVYLNNNGICSVCSQPMKTDDRRLSCRQHHFHCSQCISEGCVLCQFQQIRARNEKNYRDLPPNSQQVIYACQIWEEKHEQAMMSNPNHSTRFHDDNNNNSEQFSGRESVKKARQEPKEDPVIGDCVICCERLDSSCRILEHCKHSFHHSCIDRWFQSNGKQSCPTCGYVYGISKGPQPPKGQMIIKYLSAPLPGYEHEQPISRQGATVEITYVIPSGVQGPLNPRPDHPFTGTLRKAYFPNTKEGREILSLLQRAFDDQHVFTIGRSTTTGQDNVVTWNDIHHKTSTHGGPERFGYPDPTYLLRVRQELADKGYK